MIASQRRWHFRLWLVLVPLMLLGLVAALVLRPKVRDAGEIPAAGSRP